MRVEYKELMEKLGVGYELSPYETRPWFLYDEDKSLTCSAEVRIGPGAEDVEVEIQFLHDENDGEDSETAFGGDGVTRTEQILLMRFVPSKDQIWAENLMFVKGENYNNKIHDWGARGCDFFVACISALQMSELPDIDELIESELTDSKGGRSGRRGRVGKKGLKMQNQPPPMGMKS